ncbi:NUDIX domain-containing protein [Jiangella rhizosphaerae]|uniref:NUDIX hydrolase n=1 Tax=Jiangella rhizosphaerae TaxID=2293569 RepID=A0A418KUX0_9ACTN|nr:NUDIX hydrolase [Jiangella rhizosphaerae]RIQ31204.1 NUDIX hydrolase [Jiangella rhizosphaerae]
MTATRSARALLFDDAGRLVLIKRMRPGLPPYWTTPGGRVEPSDASVEAALHRELMEELGATAELFGEVHVVEPTPAHPTRQHVFLARLLTIDAGLRCGPELTDGHVVDLVAVDRLTAIDLRPPELVGVAVELAPGSAAASWSSLSRAARTNTVDPSVTSDGSPPVSRHSGQGGRARGRCRHRATWWGC